MPRFFDKEVLSDDQIAESCECENGGVSNEYLYNDYRNRMPFHYIEDGKSDGYYYWTYGATMELSIRLSDALAVGDESPCGCDIVIDSELSETSKNPVQNKAVTAALNGKLDKKSNKTIYDQAYIKDSEGNDKLVNISTDPSSSGIPSYDLHGHLYAEKAEAPKQAVNKDQLDEAVSTLPTNNDLHLLEAKLNENIAKNPNYTYIVTDATSLDWTAPTPGIPLDVDWGDGNRTSVTTREEAEEKLTHTYTDGIKYHLLTIYKYATDAGFGYVDTSSFIEVYIGKNADIQNFNLKLPNATKFIIQEGVTSWVPVIGTWKVDEVVIPESVTLINNAWDPACTCRYIIKQTDPTKIKIQDFKGFTIDSKLIVPKESINAYKTATAEEYHIAWSTYADIMAYEIDSSDLDDIYNELDTKLTTTTTTTNYKRAYTIEPNGTQSITNVAESASKNSIALRKASGGLSVGDATIDAEAVNLKQLNALGATKLNTSGGTITGDLVINGDLTVKGTEILENVENLNVKNPMIYANADKATLLENGGLGININGTDTYGIVYNPTNDSVELGIGKSDANGKFTFNDGEGNPVAIRDTDSKLNNNHLIVWDSTNRKFIDSTKQVSDFVDLVNPQTIAGLKTFSDETHFSGNTEHSGNVNITDAHLKILDTANDLVTQYYADKITIENGTGETAKTYSLTLPKDTGVLALNKFKYSEFTSDDEKDYWNLTDPLKSIEIKYQDENSYASLLVEKDYVEMSDVSSTGSGKVNIASDTIFLATEDTEGKHKIVSIKPESVDIGNGAEDLLLQIDSTGAKFSNRPQVKTNGTYTNVALMDDLSNYVPAQSEADGYYSQVSNENGQFSVRVFQNGDEDLQNLIINKDGVTVSGKKLATDTELNALEAKLNENIVKDPSKTYVVVNATSLDFSILADTIEVDWGDGTTGSQVNGGSAINIDHTYTDGVKYHLVTIKKLEDRQAGYAYAIGDSGFELYIGTGTEDFITGGSGGTEYYSNLRKIVYAEGITSLTLPAMVKEPVVIPKSCASVKMAYVDVAGTTIPKIIIQDDKLLTDTAFSSELRHIGKVVVPKEYVNSYKTASGWSTYASKIVYEVDSSDIPDVSNFVNLTENQQIGGSKTFTNTATFQKPLWIEDVPGAQSYVGMYYYNKIEIQDITELTKKTFLFPDNSGTLALTADLPDMTKVVTTDKVTTYDFVAGARLKLTEKTGVSGSLIDVDVKDSTSYALSVENSTNPVYFTRYGLNQIKFQRFGNSTTLQYSASSDITNEYVLEIPAANGTLALQADVDEKVDKLSSSLVNQAYVRNGNGEDTGLAYTYTAEGNTLGLRNASGQLQVEDPLTDKDAVNKLFMETAIKATRIAHISNSLLGG